MFKQLFLGLSLLFWAYPSLAQPTYTPEDVEQGKKYQAEALANVKAFKSNLNPSHYQDLPADQWMDGVKSAHFFLKNYFVPNKNKKKTLLYSHKLFIYLLDIRQKKNELISYEYVYFFLKGQVIDEIELGTSKPAYKFLSSKYPKSYFDYSSKYGDGEVWLSDLYFEVSYLKFFGSKDRIAHVLADKIVMKHEDFWLVASFVPQDNWDTDALQREIDAQQAEMDKEIAFLKPLAQARNEKEGAIVKARSAEQEAAKELREAEVRKYKTLSWSAKAEKNAQGSKIVKFDIEGQGKYYMVEDEAGDYLLYNPAGTCLAYFTRGNNVELRYEGYLMDGSSIGSMSKGTNSWYFYPKRRNGTQYTVENTPSGTPQLTLRGQSSYIGTLSSNESIRIHDRLTYFVGYNSQYKQLIYVYYLFFM